MNRQHCGPHTVGTVLVELLVLPQLRADMEPRLGSVQHVLSSISATSQCMHCEQLTLNNCSGACCG